MVKVVRSHGVSQSESYLQHEDLKDLPRSLEVFQKIVMDPVLSYNLPQPGCTAGKVLQHAVATFTRLHERYRPMTFKFGITHCAAFRWHNPCFGYKHSRDTYDRMHVFYATSNPYGPAFLEAALIDRFQSSAIALYGTLNFDFNV